jgi:DNA-binding LacI/PurR family transcriptional regulator
MVARPVIIDNVAKWIMRSISEGTWSAGNQLPSVRKLASQLHVSHSTVVAVIRQLVGHGLIEVQERCRMRLAPGAAELAQRLLRPAPLAPQPRRIALLVVDQYRSRADHPFHHMLMDCITVEVNRQGWEISVVWWPVRTPLSVAQSLSRANYDAAICLGFTATNILSLAFLYLEKFPLVLFNWQPSGLDLHAVTIDLYGAARKMAATLVALGHRNLCLVTHPLSAAEVGESSPRGMANGWVSYLEEKGLLETCSLPLYVTWGRRDTYDSVFRMVLSSPNRPTAIVFAYGIWAKEYLLDDEFVRFEVPGGISLASLEMTVGIPALPWCPPLTNLEINHTRTAQCLVETVQKMLDGETCPLTIRVPLDMNVTESIGPPPAVL